MHRFYQLLAETKLIGMALPEGLEAWVLSRVSCVFASLNKDLEFFDVGHIHPFSSNYPANTGPSRFLNVWYIFKRRTKWV